MVTVRRDSPSRSGRSRTSPSPCAWPAEPSLAVVGASLAGAAEVGVSSAPAPQPVAATIVAAATIIRSRPDVTEPSFHGDGECAVRWRR